PLMISAVADGESEMVVPDTVITPPGVRVCPPITNVVPPPGRAVYVAVPIVKSGGFVMGAVGISVVVTPFTTTAVAPGDREIVVPATVITPPGVRAEPPIKDGGSSDTALAVRVVDPIVRTGGGAAAMVTACGSFDVVPPITIAVAEGASETGVPPTVITGPPGDSVWVPTTTTEDGPILIVCDPTVPTTSA
ncbi:uncharacterized protein K441DRAFT_592736, partial [Cenococcum geophilum 1.58]